jgi:hypothetical protein
MEGVQELWGSRRSGRSFSQRAWGMGPDNVFGRSSALSRRDEADDEEALKWAALEKLPTCDRLRTTILQKSLGSRVVHEEVDVTKIGFEQRRQIIDNLLRVADQDNERFLKRLRARLDRVGIKLPTVEVRYEKLSLDANVLVGGRALPSLKNATLNFLQVQASPPPS